MNNKFTENEAKFEGGAILATFSPYIKNEEFLLKNNSFFKNKAYNGAALYLKVLA